MEIAPMIFRWLTPTPPLEAREKAWVEVRMGWLADQFGIDRLTRGELVLPTESWLADLQQQTPEAARLCLDRLCGQMGIDPAAILLTVREDCGTCGSAEPLDAGTISLARSQLADAESLAAALVYGLTHELLRSRKGLADDEPDRDWVADLLPVFLGLGIIACRASGREKHEHAGHGSSCSPRKLGYLPARMMGYGLALLAWLRDEDSPPWAEDLRGDAGDALRSSLRYLWKTDDSLFSPESVHRPHARPSLDDLLRRLTAGSDSARIAALWELGHRGPLPADAVTAIGDLLAHRQPGARAEAARALAIAGPAAETMLPELIATLDDRQEEVRAAAAYALGQLRSQAESVVPQLAERLDDAELSVVATAALAIARFGPAAEAALPRLLSALDDAFRVGHYGAMDYLVQATTAVAAEPQAALQAIVESYDRELRYQAQGMLSQCHTIAASDGGPGAWFGRFRR
jgi:hypothetical protein